MSLAAAELYRVTGTNSYLTDAKSYLAITGRAYSFDYADLNAMAAYEIGRLDSSYRSTAAGLMAILLSIGSAAHAEEVFVGEAPASGHLLDRAYIRRAPREDAIQFTSDRHIRRTFDR